MKFFKTYESFINEAKHSKVFKAAKRGSYPATIVVIKDKKVIHQEQVNTPEAIPAAFNVLQRKYPKAIITVEDKTGATLYREVDEVKNYMQKIDLKDFKAIKKGTKLLYMGGEAEVVDNNGFVLTLKQNGKKFTVNKSMFDHGGMIKEGWGKAPDADKAMRDLKKKGSQIDWLDDADDDTKKIWEKAGVNPENENTVILYSYVSHQWDDAKKILKKYNVDFKELEDPNADGESFIVFVKESVVDEAANVPSNIEKFAKERGVLRDVKQIARWAEKAGKRITGGTAIGKGYDTLVLDLTYQGAEVYYDTYKGTIKVNGKPVDSWKTFSKAVEESVTEAEMTKKTFLDLWKEVYGENFISEFPAVAKILKNRPNDIDKREISRIWDETYGEDFKEEYPGIWNKLD
jgi:hypothetical protein